MPGTTDNQVIFPISRKLSQDISLDTFLNRLHSEIQPVEQLFANYQCAAYEIETKFKVLNERFSLYYDENPIETIKTRIKSMDSILRKLEKKGLPISIESMESNIFDIAGVRVVCSFQEDIYRMADLLLQQDDITLIRRRDYIENPKPSGYRSLHLIVQVPIFIETGKKMMHVEVQLRTIAMDFWASLEHKIRYKKDIPEEIFDDVVGKLRTCADISSALDTQMQDVRNEIMEGRRK